jgi:hypothetical protein
MRMRNRSRVAAAAVVLSVAGLMLWRSKDGAFAAPSRSASSLTQNGQSGDRPRVDIVFALDTTSSMSGLIDGAKSKIWEIARRAQEGQPAPDVRIGLVAYRDRGDDYVTKVLDLTGDLDKVYATLMELQAAGGGDGPEHVLKGLSDAVNVEPWSNDPKAVKLVYLVGDAPPHEDYDDGLSMEGVLRDAHQRGIRISAIRCGNDSATLAKWTTIATRTDGEVSSIEQNGGVQAVVTTPYDAELARLNAELAKTEIHWGSASDRSEAARVTAANMAAPVAAQADRAGFYAAQAKAAGGAAPLKNDLAAAAPADVAKVKDEELPDEMQRMTADQRATFVAQKQAQRAVVLGQIKEASDKREAALKAAPPKPAAASAFDSKVMDSLKKAGATKGIAY